MQNDRLQNHQPQTTPSLQELANLMDLDLGEDDPVNTPNDFSQNEFIDRDNYIEDTATDNEDEIFDNEEFNPEKNRTKISLRNSGVAKAAVVGGGSLATILGGMMLFQGQLPKEPIAQVVKKKDPTDDKITSAQAAVTKAQQSESEIKAQLALAKQKDSLTQAQNKNLDRSPANPAATNTPKVVVAKVDAASSLPVVVTPLPKASNLNNRHQIPQPLPVLPTPKVQQAAIPQSPSKWETIAASKPRRLASQPFQTDQQHRHRSNTIAPSIANVNSPGLTSVKQQPLPNEQIIASKAAQKPILKAIAIPGLRSTPTDTNTTIDANTELQQLAAVGRYGNAPTNVEVPMATNPEARSTNLRNSNSTTVAMVPSLPPLSQYFQKYADQQPPSAGSNVSNRASYLAANSVRPAYLNAQEMMQNNPATKSDDKEQLTAKSSPLELPTALRTLLVGTSAKGSAVTPVLWGGGANSTARFLLKLDEPMLDGNNREAFPAGTQFVVTAKAANTNIGLAELEVVSVIIKGMEFAPPAGSIAIRDERGGLLIGEDYFKRDEQIANRDMMTVFSGALSSVGRLLNQPISSVSSSINGTTSSTTNIVTNREPNIVGAVLEGGFKDLSSVWSQRNQQVIQELASKPNVYQIPSGRAVRVFVNQSMTF